MAKTEGVRLDAGEMVDFLNHIITNNRQLQEKGLMPAAVEIIGESGLGKTSISLQVAENFDINHVKLNLAQIEDLGDLVGFPVRQFEMKQQVQQMKPVNGEMKSVMVSNTLWVDEVAVDQYIKQGYKFTDNKRMSYCPPEWIAGKQGGGVLILDDWNRADNRFIQAIMELVDRGQYISWKLPQDWHIVLTANPDDGKYIVNAIDVAQKTRFISGTLKWSHERWAEWAEKKGIDTRCINFVLMYHDIVNAEVNPRSLVTFFNAISSIKDFHDKDNLAMIQMIAQGTIGFEASLMFTTFINNNMDKMVTPEEMIHGKDFNHITDRLKDALSSDTGDYKSSIASVLTTRLTNYALHFASSNPVDPAFLKRVKDLSLLEGIFTEDLKYVLVKRLVTENKQKFQKLVVDEDIQEMLLG